MGNFSSCTTSFNAAVPAAHGTSSSLLAHTPPHVARVLLIDGSMLKFRAPIRVIKLLLDYPNHLICPLDSLKPGLHSLSSLLPDEKLQLGRLYLLLPFKGNLQESCIKGKQGVQQKKAQKTDLSDMHETEERAKLLPGEKSSVGFAGCADFYKKGDMGRSDNYNLQSRSSLVQGRGSEPVSKKKMGGIRDGGRWQQKNRVRMMKPEVGSQDCAEGRKIGDVGLHHRRRSATGGSYGKLSEKRRVLRRDGNEDVVSPLCDTPELQRAYRSLLRRSSSWSPRLQPILERR